MRADKDVIFISSTSDTPTYEWSSWKGVYSVQTTFSIPQ